MDLSGLKWPVIIAAIVLVGWLMTSGGVNWMVNNFTEATPGVDVERDKIDEAGLTRVGGYLMRLWQWERARDVLETSLARYGEHGENYWHNLYRLVRVYEKLEDYQEAYDILQGLIANNANQIDNRVPNNDNLSLRASKLREMYELS